MKGLIRRLRNRFNVSVAEVAANNLWQRATLGVAVVNENSTDANRILYKVLNTVENDGNVEVLDHRIAIG